MKMLSWNVNGIRAVMKKNFLTDMLLHNPDIICLQETKAQVHQIKETLEPLDCYHIYGNEADRKGYSGTAVLSKIQPLSVNYDIGVAQHDCEGRVITAEYDKYYVVTVYTPNSGNELKRLAYRQHWDKAFLKYLKKLETHKQVIVCGDLNVAHTALDLARPKENYNKAAGYMQEEIDGIQNLIDAQFVDTFRHKNPELQKYTWWSYRAGARQRNVGWRIDYFLVSRSLTKDIEAADCLNEVHGSDHCPVMLKIGS
jgi:exodeoxyribonuclease-3